MSKTQTKKSINEALSDLEEVYTLATELFNGSKAEAAEWMETPTTILFGASPIDVVLVGDGEVILKWLKERLNRHE